MRHWRIPSIRSRSSHQKSWLYKPQPSSSCPRKLEDSTVTIRITPKTISTKKKKRRTEMAQLRRPNLSTGSSFKTSMISLSSPRTSNTPLWRIETQSYWTLTKIFRIWRNGSMVAGSYLRGSSERLKTGFTLISSGRKFIWRMIFSSWLKAS
jgi:hypothetical protein